MAKKYDENELLIEHAYGGTNYHQDAIDAAQKGDWGSVANALAEREKKVAATGQNYGKSSSEIMKELMSQFGGSIVQETSPAYEGSDWDKTVDDLAQRVMGMNFTDWTKGDAYKALAERYTTQAQKGMQDVLGEVSARTGGLASSYAGIAAQQQYDETMRLLEDAAREMYGVERGELVDNLQLAGNLADRDYGRYTDDLSRFYSDRDYHYTLGRDKVDDGRYEEETAYNRAMQKAETMAVMGDFSGYKALGYTDEEIASLRAGWQKMQATTGKGGGGDDTPTMNLSTAKEMAKEGRFTDAVIQTLLAAGYDEEYIKSVYGWDGYETAASGLNESHFNASMQSISAQLQAGKTEAAESNVNRILESLSEDQRAQLQEMLDRYGLDMEAE